MGFLSALKIYDNPTWEIDVKLAGSRIQVGFMTLQSAIIAEKMSFEPLGEYICIKT